jgi:3-(3-hydroxy-phenyl)propionate hydroxylase
VSGRDPVVVAGAGPTGLMCALALGKQGIPVILCEAEPALTVDLRAGSFHPPTLEMMAPYGITQRMHETGIPVRHWQIRDRTGEFIAEFDLGLLAEMAGAASCASCWASDLKASLGRRISWW